MTTYDQLPRPMTSTCGHRSIKVTAKIISWPEDTSWIRRETLPHTKTSVQMNSFIKLSDATYALSIWHSSTQWQTAKLPMTSTCIHRSIKVTAKIISWPEDTSWIRRETLPHTKTSVQMNSFILLLSDATYASSIWHSSTQWQTAKLPVPGICADVKVQPCIRLNAIIKLFDMLDPW